MMKINTKRDTRNSGIPAFLVLLVIGVVVMSGCIDGPKGTTSNGTAGGDESGVTASDTGDTEETAKTTGDTPELPTETEADEEESIPQSTPSTEHGLVAYYPFNGDSKDYSGQEYDGTNYGAAFVAGKIGQALSFDGKDDFVHTLININPIPMPQMTMAAWVKAEDGIGIREVVCHDNSGYDRCMGMDNRGGGQGWSCFAGNARVLGTHPITVGKWTFIATVYDDEAETVKLFVDGSIYEKKGKIVGGGNTFILIGARGSTENQNEYFNGAIDEVKIYDYALSNKELKSLYETGVARPESK